MREIDFNSDASIYMQITIAIDVDKMKALEEMKQNLTVAMAWGCCKNVTREEVHQLVDEIFDEYDTDR